MRLRRNRRHWTPEEDRYLAREWSDVQPRTLMSFLGRTWLAIAQRAWRMGLAGGAPQGYEYIRAAARRVGFSSKQLQRILAWANVPVRPRWGAGSRAHHVGRKLHPAHPWLVVERDAVDRAVRRWCRQETVLEASRRTGVSYWRLRLIVCTAGLLAPVTPGTRPHARLDPEAVDRALQRAS